MPLWRQNLDVEGILWMLLPLLHISLPHVQDDNSNENERPGAWIPWLLVVCYCYHWSTWKFFPILSGFSHSHHGSRQPVPPSTTTTDMDMDMDMDTAGDVSGSVMASVLPTMMLYAMAQWDSYWLIYAKVMFFSGLLTSRKTSYELSPWLVVVIAAGAAGAAGALLQVQVLPSLLVWIMILTFRVVGVLLQPIQTIVTMGELHVLQSVLSVAVVEWLIRMRVVFLVEITATTSYAALHEIPYGMIALSGLLGCGLTCLVVARLQGLGVRLVTSFLGPLIVVETTLWWVLNNNNNNNNNNDETEDDTAIALPLSNSFGWLFYFLLSVEETSGIPQWYGLVYWAVALAILGLATIWMVVHSSSSQQHSSSVVVTRKWFHFVAIVLFWPITCAFPRLMGLGYAIATCGLLLLEILRHDIPLLQQFYQTLLDPTKDKEDDTVISHLLLVVGCAAPLWMAQLCRVDSILLQLWGVLVLGVGDAMAAIIGKWYGRHVWGQNQRTMEGSLAMGCSMTCVGMMIIQDGGKESKSLLVLLLLLATIISTLLEAFTWQMDNLVLPLAGSVILLLKI
jgi:dolichol kinase